MGFDTDLDSDISWISLMFSYVAKISYPGVTYPEMDSTDRHTSTDGPH